MDIQYIKSKNDTVDYRKCSKISNTSLCVLKYYKMLVIKAGFTKLLSKKSDLGLHCLSRQFWQTTSVPNFRTSTVLIESFKLKNFCYNLPLIFLLHTFTDHI